MSDKEKTPPRGGGVLDLSSPNFDVDAYISKLLKEKSLDQLVAEEEAMVNQVRRLDSDVHQIVYENYNKFLTATASVRKIEQAAEELDKDMASLRASMQSITALVKELAPVLDGKKASRGNASSLARNYRSVHAVQFVSELPNTLQSMLDEHEYSELVRLYLKAKDTLAPYADIDNVQASLGRAADVIATAQGELRARVSASATSVEQAGEALSLLSQLGVAADELQDSLVAAAEETLRRDLASLSDTPTDVLELVDSACSSFLPDLALCASLYRSHWPFSLNRMLDSLRPLLDQLNAVIRSALISTKPHDTALIVRSLDRFYSKASALEKHLPELSNVSACAAIVDEISTREVGICRQKILSECSSTIDLIRESLLEDTAALPPLVSQLLAAMLLHIKTALAHLLLFTASDVTFASSQHSQSFRSSFARLVYEQILVGANMDIIATCSRLCAGRGDSTLPLVLALVAHEWAGKGAQLEVLCREQFSISADEARAMSKEEEVASAWRSCAHSLLTQHVQATALSIGDPWATSLSCLSLAAIPRGVSLSTKRMREEMRKVADTLGAIFGEETRKDAKPRDRERKPVTMPTVDSLKDSLWSERIDLHAPIHFKRSSMMGAIAKGVLKAGVDGVRMNTLSTYALQQIQVDVAYLQDEFTSLVGDDALLSPLFDSILSSSLRRCPNPQLMHPSVVADRIHEEEALKQ